MNEVVSIEDFSAKNRLDECREDILHEWERRVCQLEPKLVTKRFLKDEIGGFLKDLTCTFRQEVNSILADKDRVKSSAHHEKRRQEQNHPYTLDELLQSYELLHEVIVDVLHRSGPLSRSESMLVRKSIHQAIQASVSNFVHINYVTKFSRERNFLSAVLDNLTDGVVACDGNGVLTLFNKATREFHGMTEEYISADQWAAHYSLYQVDGKTPLEKHEIPLYRALRGEVVRDAEMIIAPKDGEARFILASGRSLIDCDGTTLGAVVAMHDISSFKAAEEARAALAFDQAQRAEAQRIEIERARLFRLFEQAPGPICVLEGPAHVCVLANPAYTNLFGGGRDLIGKSIVEGFSEDKAQEFSKLLDEVYRTGVAYRGVEIFSKIEQLDGSQKGFFINFIYQPMLNGDGKVEGIVVVANDVTSQVEARTLIRLSEERFRNLADSMPQLVWTAHPNGEIDYVNRGFRDFVGRSEHDIRRWRTSSIIHPDDLNGLDGRWNRSMEKGEFFETEIRFRRFDGQYRWVLIRALPMRSETGEISTWCGSCTDIDDQKKLATDLEIAKTRAENATKAKSTFLANMSHEIRTPLGAIVGFSEFLLDPQQTDSDHYDCVMAIRRNAEQLSRLINELLDLSKIEADRLEIEKVNFQLDDVVQDVYQLLSIHAREKGIDLNFRTCGPLQRRITSDPTRLRQILINVVGNAIKFTERGGVDVHIAMISPNGIGEPLRLTFAVRDTGIGLTADQTQRIWEPFIQADPSTTRKFGGTGLGLPLSRNLARALGGDLVLTQSEAGGGSTFTLSIEAGAPEVASLFDAHAEVSVETVQKQKSFIDDRLKGACVLVVEDSPDNQALVRRLLTREGVVVDVANDGEQGVEKALVGNYDVVLMDVQMPKLDGYEATTRLRQHGYKIPIIALTAHAMKGEKERAIAHGFDGYLTKPIDRKTLLEKVASFVEKKFMNDASIIQMMALDDPEIAEIVMEFKQSIYPGLLKDLRSALRISDWHETARLAHRIKGSVGNYISPKLTEVAGQMEEEANKEARSEVLYDYLGDLEKFTECNWH